MFLQSETMRVKHHRDEWYGKQKRDDPKPRRTKNFSLISQQWGPFSGTVCFHFVFLGKTCIKQIYGKFQWLVRK